MSSSGNRFGPWDDTLLIRAFDNAVREHQKMHGVAIDDKDVGGQDELSEEDRQLAGGELKPFLLEEASGDFPNADTGVQPLFSEVVPGSHSEAPSTLHAELAASVAAETTEISQTWLTSTPSGVEQQAAVSSYEQSWQQYYESIGYPSSCYEGQPPGSEDASAQSGAAAQPAQRGHCLCCTQSTTASASAPCAQFQNSQSWTYAPPHYGRQGILQPPPTHSTSAPAAVQPRFQPHIVPPPTPPVHTLDAPELQAMLQAWYQAGYVAGRVEGRATR